MGAVYAADHPRLPRMVALKTLTAATDDATARAQFQREAEMVARLDHPNIVTVLDRGIEGDLPWISMQFVDGTDCAHALKTQGPFSVPRAVHVLTETAKALDDAHAHGVLHRDVKPANIMLRAGEPGQSERVLLTDFGIATVAEGGTNITSTGFSMATLGYASPEQLRGERLDGRSDQYSLGCTLYALLTGEQPFVGTPVAVMHQHLHVPVTPLGLRRPDIPPAVDTAIARAMAKQPSERFGSSVEFAEAVGAGFAPPPRTLPVVGTARPPRRTPLVMASVAAVAVAGVVGFAAFRPDSGGPQGTPTTPVTTTSTTAGSPTSPPETEIWKTAQPALSLWPQLLPSGPTATGYGGMVCTPTTTLPAQNVVPFTYKLQCKVRVDSKVPARFLTVDLLAFPPGKGQAALDALPSVPSLPVIPKAAQGMLFRQYEDPVEGTWMLLFFTGADRRDYHFQVGSKDGSFKSAELHSWIEKAAF